MRPTPLAALLAVSLVAVPARAGTDPAERAYQGARTGYYALKADAKRRRLRDAWLVVARRFEAVAKAYPRSPRAPDSLFTAAQMLGDLSRISLVPEDLNASVEDYRTLLDVYPRHRLADDAALALAHAYLDRLGQPDAARRALRAGLALPPGDQHAKLKALLASLPAEAAPAREPVVRRSDAKTRKADARAERSEPAGPPEKLAAAFRRQGPAPSARPAPAGSADAVASEPTDDARTAASEQGGAADADPDVDAEGSPDEAAVDAPEPPSRAAPARRPVAGVVEQTERDVPRTKGIPDAGALLAQAPAGKVRERLRALGKHRAADVTLAEQLGLKVRRIVLDAGHGGHDTGTVGASGTKEKDVALAISRRLAAILTEQGFEVVQTRERDRFVKLEDRTRIANAARGDLFISIHCNSAPQRSLRGIETYSLNLASDRYAIRLAARENATSEKGMADLQFLLADLATRTNTEESVRLASRVQTGLVSRLSAKHGKVHDLGTKEALFYVLLGAKMPAILVETSFLSNAEDEKRLATPGYQDDVARAIAAGVQEFLGNRERVAKVD